MSTRVDAVIRGGTIADGKFQIAPGERVVTSAGVVNGTIHLPLTWSISGMRA